MDIDEQLFSVVFLPDGRPAPALLTADETVSLLRLDNGNPLRTLKFYRDEGLLVGIRVGKKVRYPLTEIMMFLAQKAAKSRSSGLCSR
jgi:hypothetical protein